MYSTKRLSEKVCDSYTSIGDPYVKKGGTIHALERCPCVAAYRYKRAPPTVTLSRHTGKQFQTQPAKLPAGGQGYFAKIPYKPEPFVDRTSARCRHRAGLQRRCSLPATAPAVYLTSQPLEKRKAGFGTKDASRKDEFTSTVRVQQFREQLRVSSLWEIRMLRTRPCPRCCCRGSWTRRIGACSAPRHRAWCALLRPLAAPPPTPSTHNCRGSQHESQDAGAAAASESAGGSATLSPAAVRCGSSLRLVFVVPDTSVVPAARCAPAVPQLTRVRSQVPATCPAGQGAAWQAGHDCRVL